MKKHSLKKLVVAPAALGLVISFSLLGPTASADETSDKQSAAQAAVDEFGGCTINVEDDDYNGAPAWEVELKNTNVENGANGRIEVKVAKSSYKILAKEDADSDDGVCDDSYPSDDDGSTPSTTPSSSPSTAPSSSPSTAPSSSPSTAPSSSPSNGTGVKPPKTGAEGPSSPVSGWLAALMLGAGATALAVRRKAVK